MSENVNNRVGGSFGNVQINNDNINKHDNAVQRNSAPNPEVNSLVNAMRNSEAEVNKQLQNNNEENLFENVGPLFEEIDGDDNQENGQRFANVHKDPNVPLDTIAILNSAKNINGNIQELSNMDEKLFVNDFIQSSHGFENPSKTGLDAPNLAKLQGMASECDVQFKILCAKHFKKNSLMKNLRLLYNASKNNAHRAYVDLLVAHTFAHQLTKSIFKELPKNAPRNPELEQSLKAHIGNLIAASSTEDIEKAKKSLNDYFQSHLEGLSDAYKAKLTTIKDRFVNGLVANKTEANAKIAELAGIYNTAAEDISNVDPEKLTANVELFVSYNHKAHLPKQCGVIANFSFNNEVHQNYESFAQKKLQIDQLLSVKNEVDSIFKDSNLKGYTVNQIRHLIESEGFGNKHLLARLERYENSVYEKLSSQINVLFTNPGKSNDAFANGLMEIFSTISRDLSPEKASDLVGILKEAFDGFNVNDHQGITETQNFKMLKALIAKTEDDAVLKANFSEVIRLLEDNRFSFKGFTELVDEPGSKPEEKVDLTVLLFQYYASAVSDPNQASKLINQCYNNAFKSSNSRYALTNMLTLLARNHTSASLIQQCGFMKNFVPVKDAVDYVIAQNNKNHTNYGAKDQEIKALLNKISNASIENNITPKDLKDLLAHAVNTPIPELNAIWNTVLYAAYHAEMCSKLENEDINSAPSRVFEDKSLLKNSLDAAQNPQAVNEARAAFIDSLDDNVKALLNSTKDGLVRKQGQLDTIKNLASSLNSKLADHKALDSVLVASEKGRTLLALKEMRNDIYTFGDKWFVSAYKDITDPDEIIKIGINKKNINDQINSKYKLSAQYIKLQEQHDSAIGLPKVSKLLSAQKLGPNDSVKGENVAVTLSLLNEHLIDDISQVDSACLKAFGIENKQDIIFSREEIEFVKDYNNYLAQKTIAEEVLKDASKIPPLDERFSDENVESMNAKCLNALSLIEGALNNYVHMLPLSKGTRLLIKQYMQISAMLNVRSLASLKATLDYQASHPELNDDALREIHLQTMANQNYYFDAILNGKIQDAPDLMNPLLSDFNIKFGIEKESESDAVKNAVTAPALTSEEKLFLVRNLKIADQNIDLQSFTEVPEDPNTGKTAFSKDLSDLAHGDVANFNSKLNSFIENHLNYENTSTASGLLVNKSYENQNKADAGINSLKLAVTDVVMQSDENTVLGKIKNSYISGYTNSYNKNLANKIDYQLSRAEAEHIQPMTNDLLDRGAVRDELRLASSYAAAKLGYAGKQELYKAYQNSKTPESEKQRIEEQMVHCLKVRGFDVNTSRLLSKARLNERPNQFILTKLYRGLKERFFSIGSDIRGIFRSVRNFFTGLPEKEAELRRHQYHEYLPAMQDMVSRIGKNEVRYVNQNMDFKITLFDALGKIDFVFGSSLKDNDYLKLKLALSVKSNAGMVISRNPDGKINLFINASILKLGLEAEGTSKITMAEGVKAGASISGGAERVLDLKFDSDEEAAAFMCKMYTAQLTDEDVRLASETSSGTLGTYTAKAQIKATVGQLVKGFLTHDEMDAINNASGDKKDELTEKYAENHPVLTNLVQYTSSGGIDLSYSYNRDFSNVIDNTGTTHEVHSVHTITAKVKLFDLREGFHRVDFDKYDKDFGVKDMFNAKDVTNVLTDMYTNDQVNMLNKKDPEQAEQFTKNVKKLGDGVDWINKWGPDNYKIEHTHSTHTSATTGNIDAATDKSIANKLTDADLKAIEKANLISPALKAKLLELKNDKKIVKVTMVRTLKQDVIDRFKNNKAKLEKEANKVSQNYELTEVIIETKGDEFKNNNSDWMANLTGDILSYKTENTSEAHNILRIKKTSL